jgi:hypothetical protein
MLNMQLDKAVTINTAEMEWEASPMAGVWRKPLAREAAEHGHTTSVVRYDANSHFSSHPHPKGEEILVNPPGSSHSPFSEKGCELLVKLDQFDPADDISLRIDTNCSDWLPGENSVRVMPLHYFETEMVALTVRRVWPLSGGNLDSQSSQ